MDKRTLIVQTAQKSGYAKREVTKMVDALLENVLEALQQGEDICLKGFGKFELKIRKARNTVHSQTKQPVHIPEKVSMVFTVSKKFKLEEGVIEKLKTRNTSSK